MDKSSSEQLVATVGGRYKTACETDAIETLDGNGDALKQISHLTIVTRNDRDYYYYYYVCTLKTRSTIMSMHRYFYVQF